MDQVIDPNGKYYYDRKEILPSSHTTEFGLNEIPRT
jgi:hypothetical protein